MAANQPQHAQMKQLPLFDGESGEVRLQAQAWINSLERLKATFNWDQAQTALVAKERLTSKAREWELSQRDVGYPMNDYHVDDPAAAAADVLRATFKVQFTWMFIGPQDQRHRLRLAQCSGQGKNESAKEYLVRLNNHLQMKYQHLTRAERDAAAHINRVREDLFSLYQQGLRPELYKATLGQPWGNYDNAFDLAQACTVVEEAERSTTKTATVNAVGLLKPPEDETPTTLEAQVAALTRQFADFVGRGGQGGGQQRRGGGGRRGNCHKCGSPDHWRNRCPQLGRAGGQQQPPQQPQQQQRQRGNFRGRRFTGRYARYGNRNFRVYEVAYDNGDVEMELGDENEGDGQGGYNLISPSSGNE